MDACLVCGTPYKSAASQFCSKCGAKRSSAPVTHCTNPECPNYKRDLNWDEVYCDLCGSFTEHGKKIDELT